MILAFEDDGCVHLYASLDAVVLQIEALDIEGSVHEVFDDGGQRYAVEWIRPNKRGWIGVSNGEYRLVPSGRPDPNALIQALDRVGSRGLTEDDIAYVDALRRRLATAS
jgi:hypothetical protein